MLSGCGEECRYITIITITESIFLGTQQLDSAESYFRKLGRFGYSYETDCGLLDEYNKRHNIDSVTK